MNKPLIICEMANNHMGDVNHGKLMIQSFGSVCKKYSDKFRFAWKFQFRDFSTYIHQEYKSNMEHKYVKRFTETMLGIEDFTELQKCAKEHGFISMCTAFDENSVDLILNMNFDIVKVASCSFNDWPLLNKLQTVNKPIIISTAGASLEQLDSVVSFMEHRNKDISLMHCVGEYPTESNRLQLNQIDVLQQRYPNISIGYSTHEEPSQCDAIKIAIGKGIKLAEKHVAVCTDKYIPNAYSVTPEQFDSWLFAASSAVDMCGVHNQRSPISDKEQKDLLQFKRGVYLKIDVEPGTLITKNDIYYAWPNIENQVLANDISKYNQYIAIESISANKPMLKQNVQVKNTREQIWKIVQEVKTFLNNSGVVYPGKADLEISHHYGIDQFHRTGITMITVVNREYCKKLIIVLPNQTHPEQYHKQKEETFVVLHGEVELSLNGTTQILKKGDVVTIEKEVRHQFTTKTGCIIEEVSSTHYLNDSYYTDESIAKNKDRKTFVTYWL
jgi:sialic acid synthase SpsE